MAPFLKSTLLDNDDDQQALILKHKDIGEILSAREKEIIDLIVTGLNNQEISSTLGITIRTVKFHTSNILHKIGVESRSKAAAAWTAMSKTKNEQH